MKFTVSAALLDACALGAISQRPTYGYDLTQQIQALLDVSESTLYPVLRRLLKSEMLTSYDEPFDGRNRRYYTVTEKGREELAAYHKEWLTYKKNIEKLLLGGNSNE